MLLDVLATTLIAVLVQVVEVEATQAAALKAEIGHAMLAKGHKSEVVDAVVVAIDVAQ